MLMLRHVSIIVLFVLSLVGCSEMQVKRDLHVADDASSYNASLATASQFNASATCTLAPAIKQWQAIPFSRQTPVFKLPNGVSAAAYCIKVPQGAQAFELYGGASSGLTFYEISLVHPSVIGLDEKFGVLQDVQAPRMIPSEGWTEFRISGITLLRDKLQGSAYLIVYVHPQSLESRVNVVSVGSSIPVPFAAYGEVKIRFHPGSGT